MQESVLRKHSECTLESRVEAAAILGGDFKTPDFLTCGRDFNVRKMCTLKNVISVRTLFHFLNNNLFTYVSAKFAIC